MPKEQAVQKEPGRQRFESFYTVCSQENGAGIEEHLPKNENQIPREA